LLAHGSSPALKQKSWVGSPKSGPFLEFWCSGVGRACRLLAQRASPPFGARGQSTKNLHRHSQGVEALHLARQIRQTWNIENRRRQRKHNLLERASARSVSDRAPSRDFCHPLNSGAISRVVDN
jgi:hypothetical protein